MKQTSFKSVFLWVALVALVAGFVYLSVETATSGAVLANFESQEGALSEENKNLKDALVKSSSLNNLEARTESLGFVKPARILYITGKEEVAKLP